MTFVANPFYQQRVERSGSRFVSAGSYLDLFAALEANPRYLRIGTGAVAIWKELVAPSIRDTYPVVRDAVGATGASAVVSHVLSYGGVWAGDRDRGPELTVVTTTASAWLSRHQPMVFANSACPPRRAVQGALSVALRRLGEARAAAGAATAVHRQRCTGAWRGSCPTPTSTSASGRNGSAHPHPMTRRTRRCAASSSTRSMRSRGLVRVARRLSRQRRSAGGRRIRLGGEPARRRALSRRRRRVRPTRPPVCADRSLGGGGDPASRPARRRCGALRAAVPRRGRRRPSRRIRHLRRWSCAPANRAWSRHSSSTSSIPRRASTTPASAAGTVAGGRRRRAGRGARSRAAQRADSRRGA